jgi:CHAD domain-containing protein
MKNTLANKKQLHDMRVLLRAYRKKIEGLMRQYDIMAKKLNFLVRRR